MAGCVSLRSDPALRLQDLRVVLGERHHDRHAGGVVKRPESSHRDVVMSSSVIAELPTFES